MADFMTDGHFERHIRRMRAIYQERQGVLVEAARAELAGLLDVEPADGGMTLIGWLRAGEDVEAARRAEAAGVDVLPLAPFAIHHRPPPGLLLGYAGVREPDLRDGVTRLAAALEGMG